MNMFNVPSEHFANIFDEFAVKADTLSDMIEYMTDRVGLVHQMPFTCDREGFPATYEKVSHSQFVHSYFIFSLFLTHTHTVLSFADLFWHGTIPHLLMCRPTRHQLSHRHVVSDAKKCTRRSGRSTCIRLLLGRRFFYGKSVHRSRMENVDQ